jgi:hypothetical protein
MNKPPDETLKQGRNRSRLLVKHVDAPLYMCLSEYEGILRKIRWVLKSAFKVQEKHAS